MAARGGGQLGWLIGGLVAGGIGLVGVWIASAMRRRRHGAKTRSRARRAIGRRCSIDRRRHARGILGSAGDRVRGWRGRTAAGVGIGADRSERLGWAADSMMRSRGGPTDVGTDDARLVVGVLALHRRSGGDLPRVLDQVAATLRERSSAAREVRALTAQARLSGVILGLLPIGFFGFLWMTSRGDIQGAFDSPVGIGAVVAGSCSKGSRSCGSAPCWRWPEHRALARTAVRASIGRRRRARVSPSWARNYVNGLVTMRTVPARDSERASRGVPSAARERPSGC